MSDTAPAPAKTQFRLYTRMVPALGVIAILSSFAEADQRGLLFQADDFALLANEAALAVPNGASPMYFGLGQGRDFRPRGRNIGSRPARRIVSAPLLENVDDPTGPAAGGASRIVDAGVGQNQVAPAFAAGTPAISSTVSRTQPAPGPGFPDSPIGLIAVSTDPSGPVNPGPGPVVPAVPEPASWLLMIFGVGWLGLSLRRRTKNAGPIGRGSLATT